MPTRFDDLSVILNEVSLFRGLPEGVIKEVARTAQVMNVMKGGKIYGAGDKPRGLYQVMSGHMKVSVSSPEGGEKIIELLSPHRLFGMAEMFSDAPYVSSVEAVTPVVVLAVGRDGLCRAAELEPLLMRRLLGVIAERQLAIERDIAAECFQSGTAKLVDYLRQLAGAALADSAPVELELEIPKHVLAARLGFTPETLSRIFRELSDGGMIHVHGKQVILKESFMRRHGACSSPERRAMPRREKRLDHGKAAYPSPAARLAWA